MPIEPFDFTYTLNSETTQTKLFNNANEATAKAEYGPTSRFFVDESKLAAINSTNYATDAFGPVTGSTTTKYRTTSIVRAAGTEPVKVFAICDGQILIQPQTGDATKVNLILKPSASYTPLKIKYFIYRGINKSDLINSNILQPIVNEGVNQPVFLRKLWKQYIDFHSGLINPTTGAVIPVPTDFPASLIGYDETQPENILIEDYFRKNGINISYQIPSCSQGEHLGNFTGEIGLDIVLDHGDYQLQNQEELFKFDLKYAREKEHLFDTATIASSTVVKIKRYKEYIHQFMDAAAFWGSHIDCGTIVLADVSEIKINDTIFTKIVNKYQTQNKIYVYIQGENNRSYNYYDATRKVYGFSTTGQLNETSGWPIIIEELTVIVSSPPEYKKEVIFNLEYNIDTRIPEPERHVALDVISPNNITSAYPSLIRPLDPVAPATVPAFLINKSESITTIFQVNGTKSCAGFLMLYSNLKQVFPLKNYYNDLFPVNLNTNFPLPTTETEDMRSWATYDKSRMVNLDDVLDVGASIQNKVVFDNGKQYVEGVALRKARRLYMAVLKRNSIHNTEYDNFNIDTVTSGNIESDSTQKQYTKNLYNSEDFSVYRGEFRENGTTSFSLSLVHENNLLKRNSFFHLGITEEEYNKLMYAQTTIPVVTPPDTISQCLPIDADNVFFHLEEVLPFTNPVVRKFKLGFRYEDTSGNISTLFPETANEVFVYTVDGFYFFSKEYSTFQEFYKEFAMAKVQFTTIPTAISASGTTPAIPAYNGEFGFDWLRDLSNGNESYDDNIEGGYERPTATDTNIEYEDKVEAFKALKREYKSIPTKRIVDQYFVSYLNLFSKVYSGTVSTTPKPACEANLKAFINIYDDPDSYGSVNKLEFDYDRTLFTIESPYLANDRISLSSSANLEITLKITCLSDFSETKQIKVLAYRAGETDRKWTKLAGLILLGRNDTFSRKELKFVFIKVKTNVDGGVPETGTEILNEKTNLINSLSHSNVIAKIEDCPHILDLSSNPDYLAGGKFAPAPNNKLNQDIVNFASHLQDLFLNVKDSSNNLINSKYRSGYFTVFVFDAPTYDGTTGQVENIGIQNASIFKNRDDVALAHEAMHGLGLLHTHKSGTIYNSNMKYVYPKYGSVNPSGGVYTTEATDNYMSYSPNRKSTWQWQWKIIKSKLKL